MRLRYVSTVTISPILYVYSMYIICMQILFTEQKNKIKL